MKLSFFFSFVKMKSSSSGSLLFKGNFTLGSSSSLSLDFTVNNQIIIIHLLWYWLLPFVVSFQHLHYCFFLLWLYNFIFGNLQYNNYLLCQVCYTTAITLPCTAFDSFLIVESDSCCCCPAQNEKLTKRNIRYNESCECIITVTVFLFFQLVLASPSSSLLHIKWLFYYVQCLPRYQFKFLCRQHLIVT